MQEAKALQLISHKNKSQSQHEEINPILSILQKVMPIQVQDKLDFKKKKNSNMLILQESELENKLIEFNQLGIQDYQDGLLGEALFNFKQAEQILTVMTLLNYKNKSWYGDQTYLGVAYYAVGWLENSFTCFEDSIMIIKKSQRFGLHGLVLNMIRIHCYLQCCIILSEIGQHQEALHISKVTLQKTIKLLLLLKESLQEKSQIQILEEILKTNLSLPNIKNKYLNIIGNLIGVSKNQNLEGLFKDCSPEFLQNSNILFFLQMQPVNVENFLISENFPNGQEFLHFICLLVVSLYCTSTESRFIENQQDPESFTEAENYLSRALEIVYLYLPKDLPLLNQLLNVHNRFHAISKQAIPEDTNKTVDDQNYDFILLKPVVEPSKCGFFIPIIRKSKQVNLNKERTKSLKETAFKRKNMRPEIEIDSDQPKSNKKKLRSLSTSYKNKPQSPKWIVNNAAEIYLQKVNMRPTPHLRKPSARQQFNNQTVEMNNLQTNKFFFEAPKKKSLNINLLIIDNLNHINYTTKYSRQPQNSFEPLQLRQTKQEFGRIKRIRQKRN
ncbi:hypothetical protein pb186bvf_011176 [Paramecium bursaria]